MSWLLAFIGFAVLVILHEFGHFTAAKAVGMRVERFSLFFPPFLWRKRRGETEYAIGALPLGGYVKISGMNPDEDLPDEVRTRAYYSQPVWKRVVVIAAGPGVNVVLAFLLLFVFFWQIGGTDVSNQIDTVNKGFPASGQLHHGDRLIAVDGKRAKPDQLSTIIKGYHCAGGATVQGCKATKPATLTLERDGKVTQLKLTPVYDAQLKRMRLGFSFDQVHRTLPAGNAASTTIDRMWFLTKETVSLPARLLNPEKRKEISGVVGGYEVTRQTIATDAGDAVAILALISLSLAIINLFPFLPLDGGHIFWAVVEKIRRKPVPYSVMERAGVIGFALVLGLFVIGLSNDIGRLTGQGFGVR
ncbi:MAG TPA: site-2 protease family protein [Thermoleophilaceae bacterium]